MVRVLFVCTGNICRSPTAEGVFRHLVEAAGLAHAIETDSCGMISYHEGEAPDRRSQEAARRRGVDLSELRARQIRRRDFEAFDLLLGMDRGHCQELLRLAPVGRDQKVQLFLEFAPELGQQTVPDPYYGDRSDFDHALDLIEAGAKGLLAGLQRDYL